MVLDTPGGDGQGRRPNTDLAAPSLLGGPLVRAAEEFPAGGDAHFSIPGHKRDPSLHRHGAAPRCDQAWGRTSPSIRPCPTVRSGRAGPNLVVLSGHKTLTAFSQGA